MKKKRLLFIGGYPNTADNYLRVFFRNLIYAIADQGVECVVVSPVSLTHYGTAVRTIPKRNIEITKNQNKIQVYYPRYVSFSSKDFKLFNTGVISERAFRHAAFNVIKALNYRFDAVYGHFFLTGGLAAIHVGNKLQIPSYVAYGECDYESQVIKGYGKLKKKDVEGLTGIVSVSGKNSRELEKTGLFGSVSVLLCPNAIDHHTFFKKEKEEARKRFGFPQNLFIVGFVGGFIERKGPLRVLAACEKIEDVYLAFAGSGPQKPKGEKVLFAKALRHDDICDFLNAIDVFVLPTLNEGCCNAVLEAMATGCAIVSSNLPFNFDVLNGSNSFLVDPQNVSEIEHAIRILKEDRKKREEMELRAFQRSEDFRIERRADRILGFIYGEKKTDKRKIE